MPTFTHGKKAVFKVGTAGTPAVVVDISSTVDHVSFPHTQDTAEVSALGNTAKAFLVGLSAGTFDVEGPFDPTTDAQLAALVGLDTPVNFEYGPVGSTTGSPKYTGTIILTSYETTAVVNDAVKYRSAFQVTGAVTRTSY